MICKDTPNFIGNRVFFGTATFGINYILEHGYSVDEVDALTGPLIGRPKTATFRLADLVGIDVWEHVGNNLGPAIPHDVLGQQYLAAEKPKALLHGMTERNWLGNKTKVGFYKEMRKDGGSKEFWPLDLATMQHIPPTKPRFESVGKAKDTEALGERLKIMLAEKDRAAELVRALTFQSLQYASSLLPEVADTPKPVDDAVRWGFGHEAGPFELWDMLGVRETAGQMKAAGYPPAAWVDTMLQSNLETFYEYQDGIKCAAYDVNQNKYVDLARQAAAVTLKGTKVMSRNAGATLHDMGDGVACVEFHTKVNALDDDIFSMIETGLDRVQQDFDALVIGNEASDFCAGGANIFMVVVAAQQGMWDTLDSAARKLQNLNMRMRYFPKPVVVAPFGRVLGGGVRDRAARLARGGGGRDLHWAGGAGRGHHPCRRGNQGNPAQDGEPGDADGECRCASVPAARVPADRAGQSIHVGGGGPADGDPEGSGPGGDERRLFAGGGQARGAPHGSIGLSGARAGAGVRGRARYAGSAARGQLHVQRGRVYQRV